MLNNNNNKASGSCRTGEVNAPGDELYDFGADARLMLRTLDLTNGKTGLGILILILRGSKSNKMHPRYTQSSLYSAGTHKSEAWWKGLGKNSIIKLHQSFANYCIMYRQTFDPRKVLRRTCWGSAMASDKLIPYIYSSNH